MTNYLLVLECCLILLPNSHSGKTQAREDQITYKQLLAKEIELIETTAGIMTTVVDKKTAAVAIAKLQSLRKNALALWSDKQRLREISMKQALEIEESLRVPGEAAQKHFQSELMRIPTIKDGGGVRDEIQALVLAMFRGCESKEQLEWHWSQDKVGLPFSCKEYLQGYTVKILRESGYDKAINIRDKTGRSLTYVSSGRVQIVLCRWREILYLAEYDSVASGCEVIAFNLETGKKLWKNRVFGTGPTPVWHSKYSNRGINIKTDGKRVFVYGNEDDGRYVEFLDIETGRTLANQRFQRDPEP